MMNWLRKMGMKASRFMYGRNGQDELVMAAYLTGLTLYVIGAFFKNSYLMSVSIVIFFYGMYRCYSKNIEKRRQENQAFQRIIHKPLKYISMMKLQWKYRKTHKYYMCRECGQIIRVPKTGQKIRITCPHCKNQFVKRT